MRLRDELPVDHRLARVYRYGAGLCGVILLVFGCLGFADQLTPFDTDGTRISGMSTNGVLSLISVVVGLALVGGALVGGNFASTLNMTVGALFLLAGPYALSRNNHVRADVFYRLWQPRKQAMMDLALFILFFLPAVLAFI